MEIEPNLSDQINKTNKKDCQILWAEDNALMQATIPGAFKNAINASKELFKSLKIEFKEATLNDDKNKIELCDSDKNVVYTFYFDLVANGKEAITKFFEKIEGGFHYDFLLFDEEMPLTKGSDAISVIREKIIRDNIKDVLIISWSTAAIPDAIKEMNIKFFKKEVKLTPVVKKILEYAFAEKQAEHSQNKTPSLEMKP